MDRYEQLKPVFNSRKPGLYRRWRNVDRAGKTVTSGCIALFSMGNLPPELVKLEYLPRLGWCYFSQRHNQHFIMPCEFYAPTKVCVFHHCEVQP